MNPGDALDFIDTLEKPNKIEWKHENGTFYSLIMTGNDQSYIWCYNVLILCQHFIQGGFKCNISEKDAQCTESTRVYIDEKCP